MPSTIYERSPGSFVARVTIAGRQVWLGTHSSREDAEAAVLRAGRGVLPSSMTVAEWAARWMLVFPGRRNPGTEEHNAQMVAPFARAFGSRRLSSIGMEVAQP